MSSQNSTSSPSRLDICQSPDAAAIEDTSPAPADPSFGTTSCLPPSPPPAEASPLSSPPSPPPPSSPAHDDGPPLTSTDSSPSSTRIQDIVRLLRCPLCHDIWSEPVTLPCGRTICRRCVPRSHLRGRISYPADDEDRLRGFRCPFSEACVREHALGDCGVDVTLNKLVGHVRDYMSRVDCREQQQQEQRQEQQQQEQRQEQQETDLSRTRTLARSEVDCQVCYALYHDPLTTGCGHTFCRPCLHRTLDYSRHCPICRRRLALSPLLDRRSCPANLALDRLMCALWPDEVAARRAAVEGDETARRLSAGLETPLFVCTLAFPQMPTFLHVFEPRYRLLVRRALRGNKTFGMVLPKRPRFAGDVAFHRLGTLLRIENVQFFPDGRCLLETVGLSRFRVVRHAMADGYVVSSIQRVDDISLEEEESTEAAEMAASSAAATVDAVLPQPDDNTQQQHNQPHQQPHQQQQPQQQQQQQHPLPLPITTTLASLETMTTQSLMRLATDFVARMRDQSVPWMTDRMLAIYGECPVQDPAGFPWWLGSVLPVRDAEKYRLLGSASVRERLKICCGWIIEWETKTW